MSRQRSYLVEIHIRELAGIDRPFSITNISPGLNVVLGPNGSGKTSLCRAISALMWGSAGQRNESIRGVWVENSDNVSVDPGIPLRLEAARNAGITSWTREGLQQHVSEPAPYLAECFVIRMEDILPASQPRSNLADRIDRELDGGFDISSLFSLPAFKPYNGQLRELKKAKDAFDRSLNVTAILRNREAHLAELREGLAVERKIVNSRAELDAASELLVARGELVEQINAVSEFPSGMQVIAEGDVGLLIGMQRELQLAEQAAEQYRREIARIEITITNNALSAMQPVTDLLLSTVRSRLSRLHELDRDIQQAKSRVAEAAGRLRAAGQLLSGADVDPPSGFAIRFDANTLSEAEDLLVASIMADTRLMGLKQALEGLKSQVSLKQELPLSDARRLLVEWLAAEVNGNSGTSYSFRMIALLFVVVSSIGFVGLLISRTVGPAITLVTGIVGILTALSRKRTVADGVSAAETSKQKFNGLKVDPPREWNRTAVETRIDSLNSEIAEAQLSERLGSAITTLQGQIHAAETDLRAAHKRSDEFARDRHIDLDRLSAALLLRAASAHAEASQNLESAREALAVCDAARNTIIDAVNRDLEPYCPEKICLDWDAASGLVSELTHRQTELKATVDAGEHLRTQLSAAERDAESKREACVDLLARRQVVDLAELTRKEAMRDRWMGAVARRDAASQRTLRAAANLSLRPELRNVTPEELNKMRTRIEEAEELIESLMSQIKTLEAEVNHAKKSGDAQTLQSSLDFEKQKAARMREESIFAESGAFLLEQTAREANLHAPGTLRRADELFKTFTNHAYRLRTRLREAPGKKGRDASSRIQAVEELSGVPRDLAELSGGTRVQLLMAIRIAFAESAPAFVTPPIFIDEALANSDPERFAAAAVCLRSLADTGRQIFYLTSDPDDVPRLNGTGDESPIHLIDIVQARS